MTTSNAAAQPAVTLPYPTAATLNRVALLGGPCITLAVPDHHPGAAESSQRVQVRTLLDRALAASPDAAWTSAIRAAVEAFTAAQIGEHGGSGFTLFATSTSVEAYRTPGCEPKAVRGAHPYVLPLLEAIAVGQEIVVLGLSNKHPKLFQYTAGIAEPTQLPGSVPANLDAAGRFHSGGVNAQGRTPGGKGGVRFGTSGLRESARDSADHYYALISDGLHTYLGHRPLLLMGVKEEIAAFRRVSHYDALLHSEVDGNIEHLTAAQIAELTQAAARAEFHRLGAEVLAESSEMRDRQRAASDPHTILEAARDGRVHKLVVRAGTELLDKGEDLLNAAAAETLRKGGEVYVLPQDQMAVTQSACAILRF